MVRGKVKLTESTRGGSRKSFTSASTQMVWLSSVAGGKRGMDHPTCQWSGKGMATPVGSAFRLKKTSLSKYQS